MKTTMNQKPARENKVTPERLRKDNKEEISPPPQEEPKQEQETTKSTRKKVKLNKSKDKKTEQATSTVTETSAPKATGLETNLKTLKRKKSFDETHTRITTYLENEVNTKVRKLNKELNIPVKELINTSLKEFFKKHNL